MRDYYYRSLGILEKGEEVKVSMAKKLELRV